MSYNKENVTFHTSIRFSNGKYPQINYNLYSFDKEDEKHLHIFPNLVPSKNYTRKNCFQILVVIKFLSLLLYCHLLFDVIFFMHTLTDIKI